MQEDKMVMFRNRLMKVFRHLHKQAKRLNISCYRVYDHDLPEFPFCIEFYGDKLYVAEYKRRHGLSEPAHEAWLEKSIDIISQTLSVGREQIYLKLRKRKEGRLDQYRKQDQRQLEFEVEENGLRFIVNLSDYLDTGLFLDHRITREKVKEEARGKIILNLFCYTGSFSVYAASGGAKEVISVDLSNTYLRWAQRNMELNGFTDPGSYKYIQADVKQYLPSLQENSVDHIILDPPTFSNSKRMEDILDIQRDHVWLINQCLRILKKGGILTFSTNFLKFKMQKEKLNTGNIKDITKSTTPFDFEGRLKRVCYQLMKE